MVNVLITMFLHCLHFANFNKKKKLDRILMYP